MCGDVKSPVLRPAVESIEEIIAAELPRSLERLRTTHVDIYYLHRDNPAVAVGRIVECLNQHVAAGRVQALGASNWTYGRLDAAASLIGIGGQPPPKRAAVGATAGGPKNDQATD